MNSLSRDQAASRRRREFAFLICVATLLAVALVPTLSRSHMEGFNYLTETMSMLVPNVALSDPLWTANQRYFYLSRPGTVWLMSPLSALSPGHGYDLLMWVVLPIFFSGLIVLVRRLVGVTLSSALMMVLLVPIVVESNFYFNDNLIAASLSIWAVVLALGERTAFRAFGAGALMGLAVLCRLDQVLLVPFVGLLLLAGATRLRSALVLCLAALAGFAVLHLLAALCDPEASNLLARLQVSMATDALWERTSPSFSKRLYSDGITFLYAFGLGLPALLIGAVALAGRAWSIAKTWRVDRSHRIDLLTGAVFLIYPFVIYLLTSGKFYDPRGYLLMVPMFAPLVAKGVQVTIGQVVSNPSPRQAWQALIGLVIVVPLLVPAVKAPFTHDSPVAVLFGRVWQGFTWQLWQAHFQVGEASVAALLDKLPRDGTDNLIIASSWSRDRQVQYSLAAKGFAPKVPNTTHCAPTAEWWQHADGRSVQLMRLHVPLLGKVEEYSAAMAIHAGRACINSIAADRIYGFDYDGTYLAKGRPRSELSDVSGATIALSPTELAAFLAHAQATLMAHDLPELPQGSPEQKAQAMLTQADLRLNGGANKP